jgi:predicted lipoprotein with Yx(FWY)xxD motif
VIAKSLGQWTIVVRKDGVRQWAFKGRPIYTHIHDSPETATGDGDAGTWHLMPHFI